MCSDQTFWWPVSFGQTCSSWLVCSKLAELSPLPTLLAATLAAYSKEREKGKTQESLFPLCRELWGEDVLSILPSADGSAPC